MHLGLELLANRLDDLLGVVGLLLNESLGQLKEEVLEGLPEPMQFLPKFEGILRGYVLEKAELVVDAECL